MNPRGCSCCPGPRGGYDDGYYPGRGATGWHIDRDCLLTMADHLFAPEIARRVARAEAAPGACVLGVDFDIQRCFDLDDATKVRVDGTHIRAIAKDLDQYNAIDTGVFRIGPALVHKLQALLGDEAAP